ncbi:unnamed protein product [Ascophyllum nodosum]
MKHAQLTASLLLALSCFISHAFVSPVAFGAGSCTRWLTLEKSASTDRLRASRLPKQATAEADAAPDGSLVLIDISKKRAKVYKSVAKGSVAEVVEPVDEWRTHEAGNTEKRSQGMGKHHAEKVDPVTDNSYLVKFYLDELSEVVSAADSVLLVGHGRAKANLAEAFAAALCARNPDLTEKIADVLRMDDKHMTENQLLKLGRRHLLHAEDPRKPT